MTEEKVDITISNNNKIMYQYNDMNEINSLNYEGQTSIVIGGVAWTLFTIALNALIILGVVNVFKAVTTRHGYDWYDGEEAVKAISADSTLKKYYYPALIAGNNVLIAIYSPLSKNEAKKLVKADNPIDLYSYTSNMASSVIVESGYKLNSEKSEFHGSAKGLQFRHFHKARHLYNPAKFHSLYGIPTLVR